MAEVFISYVQEDGDVARQIADGLEAAGYAVWYYERDSLPGHSYLEQILEVIDQARAVVVILSPAALGSPQVNIEISEAHVAGKRFVPLLHGMSYATLTSRQRPWTMMFGTAVAAPIPAGGAEELLPRLVRGLRALGVAPPDSAGTAVVPGATTAATANGASSASIVAPTVGGDSEPAAKVEPVSGKRTPAPGPSAKGISGEEHSSRPTAATVVQAGNVPMFRGNVERSGEMPGPGPQGNPKELWRFMAYGVVHSSPAVVGGMVYFGSDDHDVYALDAATGEEVWRFTTGDSVRSSPAVVGGMVYVGSRDGAVYALDAATGEKSWRFATGGNVYSSPAVVGRVVYVGSMDGSVYALTAATGAERWRFTADDNTCVVSSPAVVNGVVYVGVEGKAKESAEYLGMYALNAAKGSLQWRFIIGESVVSAPAVVDGMVYIGSRDHVVYALNAATGDERWRFTTGNKVESSPAVVGSVVYIGSQDDTVYALDAASGAERWRFVTDGFVSSSPAVVDGVVYAGGWDRSLYALDAATGAERWRFATDGFVSSSPVVVDGVVYIGSRSGSIYAIGNR